MWAVDGRLLGCESPRDGVEFDTEGWIYLVLWCVSWWTGVGEGWAFLFLLLLCWTEENDVVPRRPGTRT